MTHIPGRISTREVIRFKDSQPFEIVKDFKGCILDDDDYEMKVEEHSAQKLKFTCAERETNTKYL